MKVSLIYPSSATVSLGSGSRKGVDYFIPLGLASISSVLRVWAESSGIDLELQVLDMPTLGLSSEEVAAKVIEFNADVCGFSVLTSSVYIASETSTMVKSACPNTLVVWGGVHPTLLPESAFDCAAVDVAVCGEGESPFCALVSNLHSRGGIGVEFFEDLFSIRGLYFRNFEGRGIRNTGAPRREELRALPLPAYDLFPLEKYSWRGMRSIGAESSRGCTSACSFCVIPEVYQRRVTKRPVEQVLQLLVRLNKEHGFRRIYLVDDNFAANTKNISSMAELIANEDLDLELEVYCRADVIARTPDLAKKLRIAGVNTVFIGVESGDVEMLRHYQKHISLEQVIRAVEMLDREGIAVITAFMIGAPEETEKSVRNSMNFAAKLKLIAPVLLHLTHAIPYPQTVLAASFRESKLLNSESWDYYDPHGSLLCGSKYLTKTRLGELEREFFSSFYSHDYVAELRTRYPHRYLANGFVNETLRSSE